MLKRAITIIQTHLKGLGHFAGNPDGIAGPKTDAAVVKGLSVRQAEIPAGGLGFPARAAHEPDAATHLQRQEYRS